MATSELLTTEDIDSLDTVIQLKPHQKDIEFTNVTKTDEGDLVSLDELYEKTGQESIDKVIAGFTSLLTRNKLKREHGLLLRVDGAESWMELPDRMNAIKGGEGFITNLAKGFVKIVLAIIKYIKGVCVWIFARLKALLGFAKTKEEIKFLYNQSEQFKEKVAEVFKKLDIHGFDPEELVGELPSNMMPSEMMRITKSKFEKTENVLQHYKECARLTKSYFILSSKISTDIDKAKSELTKIINAVKKAIKENNISKHDIVSIKASISEIGIKYLDPKPLTLLYQELAEKFYNIKSTNLGVDGHINTLKDKIKNEIETVKINYNKQFYEQSIESVKMFVSPEAEASAKSLLGPKGLNYLKNFVNDEDAILFDSFSTLTVDPSIRVAYLEFSNNVKTFSAAVQYTTDIVNEIEATLGGLTKLYTKVNVIVCALASGDLSNLKESLDTLSEEEKEKLDKEDPDFSIFHFKTLDKMFYDKHPDGHVEKAVSDFIAMTLEDQNFGRVLKSFGNYLKDINR